MLPLRQSPSAVACQLPDAATVWWSPPGDHATIFHEPLWASSKWKPYRWKLHETCGMLRRSSTSPSTAFLCTLIVPLLPGGLFCAGPLLFPLMSSDGLPPPFAPDFALGPPPSCGLPLPPGVAPSCGLPLPPGVAPSCGLPTASWPCLPLLFGPGSALAGEPAKKRSAQIASTVRQFAALRIAVLLFRSLCGRP